MRILRIRYLTIATAVLTAACSVDRPISPSAALPAPAAAFDRAAAAAIPAAFGFFAPLGPGTSGHVVLEASAPRVDIRCVSEPCAGAAYPIDLPQVNGDRYVVSWKTPKGLPAPATYRIRVLIGSAELGHVDLSTADFQPGSTIPVAFWIRKGALALISATNGGTATLLDGSVTVAFSPGALQADAAVTASPVDARSPGADRSVLASTLYEFQPSPTTFTAPVRLTLQYPPALPPRVRPERLALCHMVGAACEPLTGSAVDRNARAVSANIASFSSYGITTFPEMLYMESHGQGWWLHTAAGDIALPATATLNNYEFPRGAPGSWSPDGSTLAYESSNNDRQFVLHLVNADGTGDHPIIGAEYDPVGGGARCPRWFPDGSRLLIDADARPAIVNRDGSGLFFPLTGASLPQSNETFDTDWCAERLSPDGKRIAFRAFTPAGTDHGSAIWVMNVDGSNIHPLVQTSHYGPFDWSADGSYLAFTGSYANDLSGNALYLTNGDGSRLKALLPDCAAGGDPYGNGGGIVYYGWSPIPGDNRLLVGAYGDVSDCPIAMSPGVNIIDVATGKAQLVVPIGPNAATPNTVSWSGDATRLSLEWRDGPLPAGDGYPTLYMVNTDGTGLQLVLGTDRVGVNALWRP